MPWNKFFGNLNNIVEKGSTYVLYVKGFVGMKKMWIGVERNSFFLAKDGMMSC